MKKALSSKLTILFLALILAGSFAGQAGAQEEGPILVPGNPTCGDIEDFYNFKIDPPDAGTYEITVQIGTTTIPTGKFITITRNGEYFDFDSELPVDGVIAKGGPNANYYAYDPEATSDEGLHAPINPTNGNPYGLSHIEICFDFEPKVDKTATPEMTIKYDWTIEKSVEPEILEMFVGQSKNAQWSISVTKDSGTPDAWGVSGTITISNPAPFPITITSIVDKITTDIPVTLDPTPSFPLEIPAFGSEEWTYGATLPDGAARTNEVTVSVLGSEETYSASAPFDFNNVEDENISYINDEVEFNDPLLGLSETLSGDKDFLKISRTYDCSYEEEGVTNTATITGEALEKSASASLEVICYEIEVVKDAVPKKSVLYDWEIIKSVDPETLEMFLGQSKDAQWTIIATKDAGTDQGWGVTGTITIYNPAPISVMIASISDLIQPGGIIPTLEPAPTLPLEIPAGGSASWTYSTSLENGDARINSVLVSIVDSAYTWSANASIDFSNVQPENISYINDQALVEDDVLGISETIGDSKTYQETLPYDCDDEGKIPNVATVKGDGDVLLDSDDALLTVICYEIEVAKDAVPKKKVLYDWTIDKTVVPETLEMFQGQTKDALWTIIATKDAGTDQEWSVTGTITVSNPAPIPVMIASISDLITPGDIAPTLEPATTFPLEIPAGGSASWTYSTSLENGDARTNYVEVLIVGSANEWSANASIDFSTVLPENITKINDEALVEDDVLGIGEIISGSKTYQQTLPYDCDDEGEIPNVATVKGDGDVLLDSDDALLTVICYALEVSKTAETTYKRTFDWTINKTVSPAALEMFFGEFDEATWTVTITKDEGTDSEWAVSGEITITNPAPPASGLIATITNIEDLLGDGIEVTVNCAQSSVGPGESITCTYEADLPDAEARTNMAEVYIDGAVDPFTGTAAVTFGEPTTKVNDSITVDDPNVSYNQVFSESGSVDFEVTYACDPNVDPQVGGTRVETNTATIVELEKSSTAELPITCVPKPVGSTEASVVPRSTYQYEIEKSVFPEQWDLLVGDTGVSEYTITMRRIENENSTPFVVGEVSVTNPSLDYDILISIVDPVLINTTTLDPGDNKTPSFDCEITDVLIEAGDTWTCEFEATDLIVGHVYDLSIPIEIEYDGLTLTATITLTQEGLVASANELPPYVTVTDTSCEGVPTQYLFDPDGLVVEPEPDDPLYGLERFSEPVTTGINGIEIKESIVTYPKDFDCNQDPNPCINVATIDLTGQHDDAMVTVNCYDLTVEKTAETGWKRVYDWTVDKRAYYIDPAGTVVWIVDPNPDDDILPEIGILPGEIFDVNYEIEVLKNKMTEKINISGMITITNNAPADSGLVAEITSLTDIIAGYANYPGEPDLYPGNVILTPEPELPISLNPGDTIAFGYEYGEESLLEPVDTENTACITIQNYLYTVDNDPEPIVGNLNPVTFCGSAVVDFPDDPVEIYESAEIEDSMFTLDPSTLSEGDLFEYIATFGPFVDPDDCGLQLVSNVTSLTQIDLEDIIDDEYPSPLMPPKTDAVEFYFNVLCDTGCTLTQGYWKTHTGKDGPRRDATWDLIEPDGEDSPFYLSGKTYYQVMWFKHRGDPYYKLAVQFIAAQLNFLGYSDWAYSPLEVQQAFDSAEAFFMNEAPKTTNVVVIKGGKHKKDAFADYSNYDLLNWANILDMYNNGMIGPGHCGDDDEMNYAEDASSGDPDAPKGSEGNEPGENNGNAYGNDKEDNSNNGNAYGKNDEEPVNNGNAYGHEKGDDNKPVKPVKPENDGNAYGKNDEEPENNGNAFGTDKGEDNKPDNDGNANGQNKNEGEDEGNASGKSKEENNNNGKDKDK
ncbi:MAG: hypothetical protein JXR73_14085 [Candidatus Omnitrophica bacterium]|nr:hypothetical protein [Candidatus Omnitrophota bacterium]